VRVLASLRRLAPATAAALAAAALLAGCSDQPAAPGAELRVVATTAHAADLVRVVGGERVAVHALLPAAADPHDYEPRPSDARALAQAALVVRAGGGVDDWLADVAEDAGANERVLDLAATIGVPDGSDPHWWLDPRNVERATERVRAALAGADPRGAGAYGRRATAYRERLRRLDAEIARCIALVPRARRKLVATHDSLGWLARRYGLETIGAAIPSRSTQAQPSAGETERLVERIRSEGARAVFPEHAIDARLERAIAREAGARVGRPLWTDALGPRGSGAETYLGAMAENAAALVDGLTGGERSCRPEAG
jgi:ABC-type Zn uptake system ZnuABC Zn-binding protein ZnuA